MITSAIDRHVAEASNLVFDRETRHCDDLAREIRELSVKLLAAAESGDKANSREVNIRRSGLENAIRLRKDLKLEMARSTADSPGRSLT